MKHKDLLNFTHPSPIIMDEANPLLFDKKVHAPTSKEKRTKLQLRLEYSFWIVIALLFPRTEIVFLVGDIFISTQSKFLRIDYHFSVCLVFFFDEISSCRSYPYHHLKMEIKAIQKQLYPFWNALFLSKISATGDFLPICLIVCSYGSQFYHCYLSFIPPRNQHRTHSTSIPKLQKELYLSC